MIQEKNNMDSSPRKNSMSDAAWGCGGCLTMIIYAAATFNLVAQRQPLGYFLFGLAIFTIIALAYQAKDLVSFTQDPQNRFSDRDEKDHSDW